MGYATNIINGILRDLGGDVMETSMVNQKIIKDGVKLSSDMMCFPFKVVLGCFIEGLENGANTLVMYGEQNVPCRIGQYYNLCEQILRDQGYKFEMINIPLPFTGVINTFAKLTHRSRITVIKKLVKWWKILLEKENEIFSNPKDADIKIGITGEIYTLLEPYINYDIVEKLHKMGVHVDVSTKLSHFLNHNTNYAERRDEKRELKPYLWGDIGGHGNYSLYSAIKYAKQEYDGIIHLLPLSCMPETTIEMFMNRVGERYKIPIYRFPIDENRFEVGFDTRLETFISLIRRKKNVLRN